MAQCVACGAELEPPIRVPHTVYVESLYRIGGQYYCRHRIIRAAVTAGAIHPYETGRNVAKAAINWGFSPQDVRSKNHGLYTCNF